MPPAVSLPRALGALSALLFLFVGSACGDANGGGALHDFPSSNPPSGDEAVPSSHEGSETAATEPAASSEPAKATAPEPKTDGTSLPLDVPGDKRLVEHIVAPTTTDPTIDKWLADEYAYLDTRATNQKKLVLWFGGASSVPKSSVEMMHLIASWGFHVLAVSYANDYPIVDLCDADPDADCHGKLRLEALEGVDHSPHIVVSKANGIENRVVKMLEHLESKAPGERWASWFLDGGSIRWSSVIVAGHSHGASTAGRISRVRAIDRAVMLSGPFDNRAGTPAQWVSGNGMTAASKLFGFTHVDESQHAQHLKNWTAMGMTALGAALTVEGKPAPWGNSHALEASAAPAAGGSTHGATVASGSSPKRADGTYRYDGVWKYLFGL